MARTNNPVNRPPIETHEGGTARHISKLAELRRTVMSALLFEDMFYESGGAHAKRVAELVAALDPQEVANVAVIARQKMYLRHIPLFLVRELARVPGNGTIVADTLEKVIERPDELGEYLALYWKGESDPKSPLSAGSKRGLEAALKKFNAYSLAKYDGDNEYKLKDVIRLVHPTPDNPEQEEMWGKLLKGELETPDTWEVELSAGKGKKETFERLLREKKLGGLAFLRNLRNMNDAGVDESLIRGRFEGPFGKVLPFRFVAALKFAPRYVAEMDKAMQRSLGELEKLKGTTAILIDVSGSMNARLSAKSDLNRIDAGGALAVLVCGVAERARVFSFSNNLVEVPPYTGMALMETINRSQPHGGTYLGAAVTRLNQEKLDRLIVITDEQSQDAVPNPACKGYLINVANYRNGVGYGPWVHIDGFSERVIDFITEYEREVEA